MRAYKIINDEIKDYNARLKKCSEASEQINITIKLKELNAELQHIKNSTKAPKQKASNNMPTPPDDEATNRKAEALLMLRSSLMDPRLWVSNYAIDKKLIVVGQKVLMSVIKEGNEVVLNLKNQIFWDTAILDYSNDCHNYNDEKSRLKTMGTNLPELIKAPPANLDAAIRLWYYDARQKRVLELVEKIKYDPTVSDKLLRRWIEIVTGKVTEWELDAIKHTMQCNKRKMLGLPVENHLFPIIVGDSRHGKSKSLEKLLSAISEFTLEFTADQITDPTIIGSFETNYAVLLDEMAKAKPVEMAMVKRVVTIKNMDGRPPYGRQSEQVEQNCTFYGTSNDPIRKLFKDREMLRFIQLNSVKKTEEQMVEMDGMDSFDLWRCIDENSPNIYFKKSKTAILVHQSTLATLDPITIWADDIDIKPNGAGKDYRNVTDLYKDYRSWAEENGFEFFGNSQTFGAKLNDELHLHPLPNRIEIKDGTGKNKKYTVYEVSKNCTAIYEPLTTDDIRIKIKELKNQFI